jgi:hypothetical protein
LLLAALVAGLSSAGCSPLGPTTTGNNLPNSDLVVENFSAPLKVQGLAFYSFSVEKGGTTYLSLLDLKVGGEASDLLITIGIGVPRGTSCVSSNVLSVKATGQLHVSATTNRGVHCALVFDPGNLTADATFSLNITHPR